MANFKSFSDTLKENLSEFDDYNQYKEEVEEFCKNPKYYEDYIDNIHYDTNPPKILKYIDLAAVLYEDPKKPDPEVLKEEPEVRRSSVRSGLGRFFRDLISGQED